MALTDHVESIKVNYGVDVVFNAILKIERQNLFSGLGFDLKETIEATKTYVYKSGASLKSWGETINIKVSENEDKTSTIQIISTPKTGIMFGGGFDLGKNRDNINKLMDTILNWLKENEEELVIEKSSNENFEEIKKLKELLDLGIITKEEFDTKKKELLGI
ncbi:MAG: SHOCT domain-containing protein [Bacilli bacterium]